MDAQDRLNLTIISLHIFVAIIVNIPQQDRITKNWARLFSAAQVIMAIQLYVGAKKGSPLSDISYILSALNNLFFLGASLVLLDRKILSINWRYLLSNRFFQVITAATVLAIGTQVAATGASAEAGPALLFQQAAELVIVLISILVYLVEGFAYFSVLGFFRHKWVRHLPVLIALFSSFIEFGLYWNVQRDLLISSITLLRFPYFIPPIMILLRRMPQPEHEVKEVFENAIPERKFILSKDTGLVKALGRAIAAQKVLLLIKRPDFNLIESEDITDKFTYYGWQEKKRANGKARDDGNYLLADISEEEHQCLYEVCMRDQHVFCKSGDGWETIMLPIIMYGGVIGVLFVRLSEGVRARSIFAEKLKLSIRAVLPLVQSSRHMAALKMLSNYFTENLIGVGGADGTEGNGHKLSVTEGVNEILGSMLETLSPLAIALKPSRHFNSEAVLWQVDNKQFDLSEKGLFEDKYFLPEPDETPFGRFVPFQQQLKFGRMIMFVREESDFLDRPTIGIHENVFKTLGVMINNALRTIIRRNLARILAAADKKIREGCVEGGQIARVLQDAAASFGILWVVIALDGRRFLGDEENITLVRQQPGRSAVGGKITPVEVNTADGRTVRLITSSTEWVVNSSSNNDHTRHQIDFWFHVGEADFVMDETWEGIFFQFIQIGTNKIKDMVMREMVIENQTKSAEIEKDKAVMTLVHLQGSLTHEFNNLIKDHELGIMRLWDDIEDLKLEMPEKIRRDMEWLKSSNKKLLGLRRAMFRGASRTKLSKMDLGQENLRPCDLCVAIKHAKDEVQLKLNLFKIEMNVKCPDGQTELTVYAPYNVVYLSIANLLSNSIKALSDLTVQSHDKRIDITTTVSGEHVFCRIRDTGQGIKEPDKLFELDSGWGLYLTKASLQDNNCTIEVIETGPSGTTFELRFPAGRRT
jgi:hypothetical protein